MITKDEARAIVERELATLPCEVEGDSFLVLDDATIERPWGWVFFYTSRLWHETGDPNYAIAGNAPYIIERASGRLRVTGTAHPIEHYIAEFEARLDGKEAS